MLGLLPTSWRIRHEDRKTICVWVGYRHLDVHLPDVCAVNPSYSQSTYSILHNFGGVQRWASTLLRRPRPLGVHPLRDDPRWGLVTYDSGVLYKINTDGSGYQILHNFKNHYPRTGMGPFRAAPSPSRGPPSTGVCAYGGSPYILVGGTVFKINTDGGGYQVLYSFGGGDIQCHPYGAPVISGTKLYGMTSSEGLRPQRRDFRDEHGRNRLSGPARIRR